MSGDSVQAVFIPDAAPTAVKVAGRGALGRAADPAARHARAGTSPTSSPPPAARIDGAVFADSFFIGSGTPSTTDFVTRFRAQNGHDPTGFEAQAYDAGMLVREAIAQGRAHARRRVAVPARRDRLPGRRHDRLRRRRPQARSRAAAGTRRARRDGQSLMDASRQDRAVRLSASKYSRGSRPRHSQ